MHDSARRFWGATKLKYPERFASGSVLEVGSYNINGSIREHFETKDYTGLDWRPGSGVDVVSLAHEFNPGRLYDTIVSGSMLEHDPHWDRSIEKMVSLLKPDGALFLSWGGAYNAAHEEHTAPDGFFHPLPAYRVLDKLGNLGLHLHYVDYDNWMSMNAADGGCVALHAFKDPASARGKPYMRELLPLDRSSS